MSDNEIIKALECCTKDDCDKCPNDFGNCYANLAGYALDLINRQKAEIEALIAGQETLQKHIAKQKEEIERYKERCSKCGEKTTKTILHLQELLAEKKAEIERLQKELHLRPPMSASYLFKKAELDEMITRAVGEESEYKAKIKAEAIKEFAERLKGLLDTELRWCECVDEITKPLDSLVKEMVGDGGEQNDISN